MKISIIALGWLGNSLYDSLVELEHKVIGTYFSAPKGKSNEIFFDFNDVKIPDEILNSELIIFNLTPTSIQSFERFEQFISNFGQEIIFISSTSVYGQSGKVTEQTKPEPMTKNGKLLLKCEELLSARGSSTVIRPGGLYGDDRHPGKSLSGKTEIKGANSPLNLTSQVDLINIIIKCITPSHIDVINAINENHPSKKEYYQGYCRRNSLSLPEYADDTTISKQVDTIFPVFKISSALP